MVTKEWTAIHRKHHAKVETADDPHSPQTRGIKTVLLEGSELYRAEAKNADTMERYGKGTPDDWIERNVYTRHSWEGVGLMMIINFMLFGAAGIAIWAAQMIWIPFFAAGVINGIGHYWGYRNFATADASTNIVPWGILIGGEELHNNHHAYGSSAKFSSRWYEFDLGWAYIRGLESLGLAKVRKVAPKLKVEATIKPVPDHETLEAVITHRYIVMKTYARTLKQTCAAELAALRERAGRGRARQRSEHAAPEELAVRRHGEPAARARAGHAVEGHGEQQGAGDDLCDAPGTERAVGALHRLERAAACAPAGLVPARRSFRHRAAGAILAAAQALRVIPDSTHTAMQKARGSRAFFAGVRSRRIARPTASSRRRKPDYLSFVSLYITCLRATGSNFLISIFSGISFLFFDVV